MALLGFGNSTTDYLHRPLTWPTRGPRPWFYSAWVNYAAFAGTKGALQFTSTAQLSTNNAPRIGLRNSGTASSWIAGDVDDASGAGNITPTYTGTVGAWTHYAHNLTAANLREVFVGGVSKGTATTALSTQTIQELQVGFGIGGGLGTTDAVAEIVVGTGILSRDQVAALAAGLNPLSLLNPAQIIAYYPLVGDLRDYGPLAIALAPTGTNSSAATKKFTAHPPVASIPRRRLFSAPGGAPTVLTAAGTAASSQAATLARTRRLGATLQNLLRNSTMQGVVAGTPGTAPTNWTINFSAGGGSLVGQIAGTGTENGLAYFDLRISGTNGASSASQSVLLDASTAIPNAPGQSTTFSVYLKLVAGSLTGFTPTMRQIASNAAGGTAQLGATPSLAAMTGTLDRYINTQAWTTGTIQFVYPQLSFSVNGSATVDATIRIAAPQLEPTPAANPFLPTSGAAYSSPYLGTAAGSSTAALGHGLSVAGSATATQTAALTRSRALTVAGVAEGSSTAGLVASHALAAAGSAAGSSAAALARARALAAAGAAAGSSAAALGRSRPLTATGTTAGSSAAALSAKRAMTATASAAASSTAALTRTRRLTAAGTATGSQSSPAIGKNGQSGLVPAGSTAVASQTGMLTAIRAMQLAAGTAGGSSAAALARSRGLAPEAASASGDTLAALARSRALVPSGAAAAGVSAAGLNAVRPLAPLAAAAVASSAVAMAAIHVLFVAGTAEGSSSATISAHAPPPSYVPASHTILVPLDAREVLIPLDPRSVIVAD